MIWVFVVFSLHTHMYDVFFRIFLKIRILLLEFVFSGLLGAGPENKFMGTAKL